MKKIISTPVRFVGAFMLRAGRKLYGEAEGLSREERAIREARHVIEMVEGIAGERRAAVATADFAAVTELDESLAYMQHTVHELLRSVLRQPGHRLLAEAIDCLLAVDGQVSEAMDLDGYHTRLRSKVGAVRWNTVRASAFAETALGVKLVVDDTLEESEDIEDDEVLTESPEVSEEQPVEEDVKAEAEEPEPARAAPAPVTASAVTSARPEHNLRDLGVYEGMQFPNVDPAEQDEEIPGRGSFGPYLS